MLRKSVKERKLGETCNTTDCLQFVSRRKWILVRKQQISEPCTSITFLFLYTSYIFHSQKYLFPLAFVIPPKYEINLKWNMKLIPNAIKQSCYRYLFSIWGNFFPDTILHVKQTLTSNIQGSLSPVVSKTTVDRTLKIINPFILKVKAEATKRNISVRY